VRVNTTLGVVEGFYNDAGGVSFLGVPYGDSVSGAFRWTVPRPAQPWAPLVLDATQQPPGCPDSANYNSTSEDCLTLNIYAPTAPPQSSSPQQSNGSAAPLLVPVVVWIHGGGFFTGNVNKPLWQGEFLVARSAAAGSPVVMVSMDYRLGALGFLATEPLNLTGNYGLLDQQLALRWVRDNVAAFGGDPERVTLHGQSAGAMSVHAHLVSPLSQVGRRVVGMPVCLRVCASMRVRLRGFCQPFFAFGRA
jgi:para-nitrobenzyl esterase